MMSVHKISIISPIKLRISLCILQLEDYIVRNKPYCLNIPIIPIGMQKLTAPPSVTMFLIDKDQIDNSQLIRLAIL